MVVNIDSESRIVNEDFTEYYTTAKYLMGREGDCEWTDDVLKAGLYESEDRAASVLDTAPKGSNHVWRSPFFVIQKIYQRDSA